MSEPVGDCRIVGPFLPVGDVDFECRTHNVLCELKDPDRYGSPDIRRDEVYCPVSGGAALNGVTLTSGNLLYVRNSHHA